jgi:hypothetical protein
MDQKQAIQPETPQTPYEAWRRFTLLDLLILFSGHEAALGIMRWYRMIGYEESIAPRWIVPLFIAFFSLGAIISIPVILFVQYVFRHRRTRLAGGEILAAFDVVYWMFIWFLTYLLYQNNWYEEQKRVIASILLILISGAVGFIFVGKYCTDYVQGECRWLSYYGYGFSIFTWIIMGLLLISFAGNVLR